MFNVDLWLAILFAKEAFDYHYGDVKHIIYM